MKPKAGSGLNTQIYEEACEWFVEFRGGQIDAARRQGLATWLRKSPEHLRAYLEIAAIWNEGPSLDPTGKWDDAALLAQLDKEPDNVIAHPSHSYTGVSSPVHAEAQTAMRSSRSRVLAMAASVLVAVVGAWLYSQRNIYATDFGEQRSVRLADGSTVDLNSRSRIEVRYSQSARAIELLDGQALFQVAKEAGRAFIVTSGDTRVRALGTQFDVNRRRSGTVVTVLEGRVAVMSDPAPTATALGSQSRHAEARKTETPVVLSAGQQWHLAEAAPQVAPVDLATAAAWKQHQLVFEHATLAEVVEEFNRYNKRQLTIRDADLYDFHISGVFSTVDPQGLLDFLRGRPGVEIVETAGGYRIAKKSSP